MIVEKTMAMRKREDEVFPNAAAVDKDAVLAVLPYGKGSVVVVEGGLRVTNDAGTDATLIANAAVIVRLDVT